jgi:mRNA interferase RelE/StbE
MSFTLRYHPDVRKVDLPLLDERAKNQIRNAIEKRLRTAPQDYGAPLRKTLKGYWKLRVGNYRIVYKIFSSEVWILGICNRRDVYLKLLTRA